MDWTNTTEEPDLLYIHRCIILLLCRCSCTFFQKTGRDWDFSKLVLSKDGVFSSIISKGHRDLQLAFSSLLLIGDFVSRRQYFTFYILCPLQCPSQKQPEPTTCGWESWQNWNKNRCNEISLMVALWNINLWGDTLVLVNFMTSLSMISMIIEIKLFQRFPLCHLWSWLHIGTM